MKNVVIAVLGVAVAGLAGYVVVLKHRADPAPAPAERPRAAAPAAPADPPPPAPEPAPPAEGQLRAANSLIAALYEENKALEKKAEPSLAKGIQQIVESPELKSAIRQGMADQVKRTHAALFKRMGLTPEQETAMTELMVSQGLAGIETGFRWLTGDHETSSAQIVAAREKMFAEVGGRFGPQALAEYQYWEASRNERESAEKFNRALGEMAMDETTSDRLVKMMYDTRSEFEDLDYLSRPENFNPREMTPERRENVMTQVEDLHGRYVKNAAPILTPEQLRRYDASLGQQRLELDGFLALTHGMFNRGAPPAK